MSIWFVLLCVAIVAAAGLYYSWQLPETLVQEETQLIYTQRGAFDYTAYLKPNTVYGGVTQLGPRTSFFSVLVESMQMTYDYDITLRSPTGETVPIPEDSVAEYEVVAILREGDLWSQEQILVPHRPVDDTSLSLSFALPIQAYLAEAEVVRSEVNTPGRDLEVEVQVRIWPTISTDAGTIHPNFAHGFTFRWQDAELVASGPPVQEESDTLGTSVTVPNSQRSLYSEVATIGLAVAAMLLLIWGGVSQWAVRSPLSPQQMASELHRRYGDVIVQALTLPMPTPHQTVVQLRSLEDIGRTAHELMKPIILVQQANERHYVVIDGADNVRYEVKLPAQSTPSTLTDVQHQELELDNGDDLEPPPYAFNEAGSDTTPGTKRVTTTRTSERPYQNGVHS